LSPTSSKTWRGLSHAAIIGALSGFLLAAPGNATPPERPPLVKPMHISEPEALLWRIYTLPNPYFDAFINPKIRPDFYTSRIHVRAERMERCYLKKYGMDFLDIDYIVPGNDYDIRDLSITTLEQKAKSALVRVAFNRSRDMIDPIELRYRLVMTSKGWRIDDVSYGKLTLSKDLRPPC